jgi:hypothetical protein
MSDFDVIIVGGGIAGASLGAEIAAARRTLIIEAEDQCGYHSTGRSAAFYLESYGGAEVAKLTIASRDFLLQPAPEFSDHGFLRVRGDLHLTRDELPELPPSIETRIVERAGSSPGSGRRGVGRCSSRGAPTSTLRVCTRLSSGRFGEAAVLSGQVPGCGPRAGAAIYGKCSSRTARPLTAR